MKKSPSAPIATFYSELREALIGAHLSVVEKQALVTRASRNTHYFSPLVVPRATPLARERRRRLSVGYIYTRDLRRIVNR